ncbi:MAG: cytochrome c [Sedimentisphaerales bacterium]|nr:cytochrome c [Sedimentisphaerales bacterium]
MKQPVLPITVTLVLICGCRRPETRAHEPAAQAVDLQPLSLPPVSTFEDACARCHGPEGSFYGEGFAEPAGRELKVVVREMMEGPAFLTPSATDVDAMVAYHRALAAGEPFLCVTAYQPATATAPGRWVGEATPGAWVSLYMASAPNTGTQTDGRGYWEIALSPGRRPTLAADNDGKTTLLNLAYAQWSHASR